MHKYTPEAPESYPANDTKLHTECNVPDAPVTGQARPDLAEAIAAAAGVGGSEQPSAVAKRLIMGEASSDSERRARLVRAFRLYVTAAQRDLAMASEMLDAIDAGPAVTAATLEQHRVSDAAALPIAAETTSLGMELLGQEFRENGNTFETLAGELFDRWLFPLGHDFSRKSMALTRALLATLAGTSPEELGLGEKEVA